MNQLISLFLPLEWISLALFLISGIAIILFYILHINKVNTLPNPNEQGEFKPVSIVLSGKNQYEFLRVNLPFLLNQNYPTFEVVVVYDSSEEENYYLLKDFEKKYNNLKLINFSQNINFFEDNRFTVSIGIKSAKYDYILLTSADCRPAHENWILEMQKGFENNVDIVIGYTSYKTKTLFTSGCGILFQNSLLYLSSAILGKPQIANNQNMGYRKQYFLNQNGYTSHYSVDSGEYEIIEESDHTATHVKVILSPQSYTHSQKKISFFDLLKKEKQIQNALKCVKHSVKKGKRFLNGMTFTFYITLLFFLGYFIFYTPNRPYLQQYICMGFIFIYLLKTITQGFIYSKSIKKFNEKQFLLLTPVFEVLYLPLQLVYSTLSCFSKNRKWL